MTKEEYAVQMATEMESLHTFMDAIGPYGEIAIYVCIVVFIALLIIPNNKEADTVVHPTDKSLDILMHGSIYTLEDTLVFNHIDKCPACHARYMKLIS